ncbi:2-dehydro-3-deoxyphosphogluconate aldolase/(4S)-4-hydroxy-2-oxoglutarate aldolase [Enterococcus sp. PF1-24]|uniref:bifunctional 4-hydroxy-2-oxoglutarate aldolase/2-dehydro-3-deoxy-phosphogluconate aldolase n=1 Tax=unclassified Enterococcus TaxID=2608891 RepID=UPI00247376D2|nr:MULTISPECIES: bifunctional 4-hydroxy-2-oxoglutarate aldolase/2-dehydro-3-deoxy-phosphogluconate aldolase [unclassified Enterococcus]MDH6364933.1 2-dehydro-3-deoxyphosphogluconate aldolase/(4S)-4-hydroxy-2-oxoglutarate aldolase [Enterococcus sp. PFB1-1]MDH6402034.1 2-dehydro-3-deoxyphosphogluconate aldolase/(4S)-4-hydroxy-2-oxoglutarate aldolase [Enterococcus sp. PF1-24]
MLANMNHELYQKIAQTKLLPLYTATDLSCLGRLEEVLVKNEVRFIEVTYRSDLATAAIKQLAASGELIVGAGTVRTLAEAKSAVANGAKFIVSPALVPEVIEYCIAEDIPVFPGTATPNDIQRACEYGIKVVKFFPADIYGGLKAINALSGPFYDVKFLPTGGINEENYLEYLENEHIIAVGGSFIISESALKKDNGQTADENLRKLVEKRDNKLK